jgi:hypothetical protein
LVESSLKNKTSKRIRKTGLDTVATEALANPTEVLGWPSKVAWMIEEIYIFNLV